MKESIKTKREIAERITLFARRIVWPENFHVCKTKDDLMPILLAIKSSKRMVFDWETTGTDPWLDRGLGLGIAANGHSYAIPVEHLTLPCLAKDDIVDVLGWAFSAPEVYRLNHNIKFDAHFNWTTLGIPTGELHCDTMVQSQVINPDTIYQEHGLKELADQYGLDPGDSGKGGYVKQFGTTAWSYIEGKCATYYLCKDTALVEKLKVAQDEVLATKPKLFKIFWEWEMPVVNIAYGIEHRGMRTDPEHIAKVLRPTVYTAYAKATEALRELIEPHLKYAGAEDVGEVLRSAPKSHKVFFERLGVPLVKNVTLKRDKAKEFTKKCLDKDAIEALKHEHPAMGLLSTWRQYDTAKKMFVDPLPTRIIDGYLHPTINTCGTSTGRFSMSRPNLQQMPSRMGPIVRNMFIPDEGNVFMSADFSQQEMRIMAHFARGGALERIFTHSKLDMYSQMAVDLFDLPESDFADEDVAKNHPIRRMTKAIVLAMGYKMGPAKFARSAKITFAEAKKHYERYFQKFPEIKLYQDRSIEYARKHGKIVTLCGRERPLPHINNTQDNGLRSGAEREATNTPIQGSAADMVKIAMVRVQKLFDTHGWPCRIWLQVHDELIFEMNKKWAEQNPQAIEQIIHTMVTAIKLIVPMKSSATFETRWGTKVELSDIEADILDDVLEDVAA